MEMTETKSNFDCKRCGSPNMSFVDETKFICGVCGNQWELTELGRDLVRSIELE